MIGCLVHDAILRVIEMAEYTVLESFGSPILIFKLAAKKGFIDFLPIILHSLSETKRILIIKISDSAP